MIVTTTTHMAWEPERPFAEAEDIPGACRLIEQYGYVIAAHHKAGQPKISGPEKEILEKLPGIIATLRDMSPVWEDLETGRLAHRI